jgi:undecaprenyl-diphosphatase
MRWHLAVALVSAGLFVAVTWMVLPVEHAVGVDVGVASWIAMHRTGPLVDLARAASWLGSVAGILPLSLVISWYLRRRHGWHAVGWYAIAIVGATVAYLALNYTIQRTRPPMGWRLFDDTPWSFPSGHSTQAVVFWFMTATLLTAGRPPLVRAAALSVAALCVLAIGGSRICLDAHWTTDVLGAFALGTCWLMCVLGWRALVQASHDRLRSAVTREP